MDTHGKDIRKMKMCMLHLEKLAVGDAKDAAETQRNNSGTGGHKESAANEKSFFCYGYYDKMTYIEDKEESFTYEHAFSIKYPYRKAVQPISADQMFTLLEPDSDSGKKTKGGAGNPFMLERSSVPFLGVFLITVDFLKKEAEGFCAALEAHRSVFKRLLNEVCKGDVSQIYYSPNCADLCIALRTDSLGKIYMLKRKLRKYMKGEKFCGKQAMHSTLYIASELPGSGNPLTAEALLNENAKQQIEIRMQCREGIDKTFRNRMKAAGREFRGVTGKGEYTLKLDYADFAAHYPIYADMKLGLYDGNKKENYTEDESPVGLLEECKFFYERWYICLDNDEEGAAVENDSIRSKQRDNICEEMNLSVRKLEKLVDELASEDGAQEEMEGVRFPKQRFMEQHRLMRDLLYTYENLWYDECTVTEGRVFYAQIAAMVEGICQQIGVIRKAQEQKKLPSAKTRVSAAAIRTLNDDLIKNMNIMISGVNDFNKLIQAVNQNLRNVPNYEMQSKVNVEKYLYAYTMYLMDICKKYHDKLIPEESKEKERIFPIVTIAMAGRKIRAYTLFQKLEDSEEGKEGIKVFLVECPNYQRFANVYHVLPMISHEISHCFRYEQREVRNEFVARLLSRRMAEIMTDELFDMKHLTYRGYISDEAMELVCEKIQDGLENYLLGKSQAEDGNNKDDVKEEMAHTHMNNMEKMCVKKMWECVGITEKNRLSEKKLWEICRVNFRKLYAHYRITYLTPADVMEESDKNTEDMLANVLIDLLDKDNDERIRQWRTVFHSDKIELLLREKGDLGGGSDMLWTTQKAIDLYESEKKISRETVELCVKVYAKRIWKSFLENIRETAKEEINRIISLLNDESNMGQNEKEKTKSLLICMQKISSQIIIKDKDFALNDDSMKGIMDLHILDEEEIFRLKQYICEAAGLIREIMRQWDNLGVEYIEKSEEISDDYIKKIHACLNKEYNNAVAHVDENRWIITKRTQELYASLGIINEDPAQFISQLQKAAGNVGNEYIKTCLYDNLKLYTEVFADLGMCKIFGFTPFGYFSYLVHLFMKERELPQTDAYDMTQERIAMVIYTLWGGTENEEQNTKNFRDEIVQYEKKIKHEKEKLEEIKKEIEGSDEKNQDFEKIRRIKRFQKELRMHQNMLRWMVELYDRMQLGAFLQEQEMFLDFLTETYDEKMDFLEEKNNPIIEDIRDYYNNFRETVCNEARQKRTMDVQNEFVLTYYGKMQEACVKVEEVSGSDAVSFAERYNRQFMQMWQRSTEENI